MSSFVFLLWLNVLRYLDPVVALNDVVSIEITTPSRDTANTVNAIQITLWFNYTIYQYTLSPTRINHKYTIDTFTTLGPSDCHKSPLSAPEAKMMIENDHYDAFITDSIAFHTASGTWYGISGRCIDSALNDVQPWLYSNKNVDFITDEASCASGKVNIWLCVDNEPIDDCGPAKQMFHFDITRANELINNAEWSDATNVIPEIVSCDPTSRPTNEPTQNPVKPTSSSPTPIPTAQPTAGPTRNPTNNPTMTPTDIPTKNPTQGPTITTTKTPTDADISAKKPTNAPTLPPSQATETLKAETTDGKTRAGEDNDDFSVRNDLFSPIYLTLYGIGGSIVCLIGCLCVVMFCVLKRHKRVKESRGLSKQVSIRHTTSLKQVNITHITSEREDVSRNTGNVTAEPYLQKAVSRSVASPLDNVALAHGSNAVNACGLYQNSAAVDVANNMGDDDDDDDDDVLAYIDTAGGVGSGCIARDAPPPLLPPNGAGGNRKRIPPPPPPPNMNERDCIGSESEEGDEDIVLDDIMRTVK